MEKESKIFVAGHRGLVGSALVRRLHAKGYKNLITKSRDELDLIDQKAVELFMKWERPDYVFVAAAKVGGIHANSTYPAEFALSNLQIQNNLIDFSHRFEVKKLLFLGSSCIYPKFAKQPINEDELLAGKLEPTNDAYAIAKIAGIMMCKSYNRQYGTNFISCMPTNLYGPGDNYHPQDSHVLPALIRRFHEAKEHGDEVITVWGTGNPLREFLYSEDLADACIYLMQNYDESEIVNIGSGQEVSIRELAKTIKEIVGFDGKLEFDESKPDGTPRKLLDCGKINKLGWKAQISLSDGISRAYEDFKKRLEEGTLKG